MSVDNQQPPVRRRAVTKFLCTQERWPLRFLIVIATSVLLFFLVSEAIRREGNQQRPDHNAATSDDNNLRRHDVSSHITMAGQAAFVAPKRPHPRPKAAVGTLTKEVSKRKEPRKQNIECQCIGRASRFGSCKKHYRHDTRAWCSVRQACSDSLNAPQIGLWAHCDARVDLKKAAAPSKVPKIPSNQGETLDFLEPQTSKILPEGNEDANPMVTPIVMAPERQPEVQTVVSRLVSQLPRPAKAQATSGHSLVKASSPPTVDLFSIQRAEENAWRKVVSEAEKSGREKRVEKRREALTLKTSHGKAKASSGHSLVSASAPPTVDLLEENLSRTKPVFEQRRETHLADVISNDRAELDRDRRQVDGEMSLMNAIMAEEESENKVDAAEKMITPYSTLPFEKHMEENDSIHGKQASGRMLYSTMPLERQMKSAEDGVTQKAAIHVTQASEITPYSTLPFEKELAETYDMDMDRKPDPAITQYSAMPKEITEMLQHQDHTEKKQVSDKDRIRNMATVIKQLKKKIKGMKNKKRMHKMAAAIVRLKKRLQGMVSQGK